MSKEYKNIVVKRTNHDNNLDFLYDNHPELLDDYINVYENSIFAVDHEISPEDMADIMQMIEAFKIDKFRSLN